MNLFNNPYQSQLNFSYSQNKSISEITEKTDYTDLKSNYSQKKVNSNISNPLLSYYDSSNKYLFRKYSKNFNSFDLQKSNNFIQKKTIDDNQSSKSNISNEDSSNINNQVEFIQNETNTVYYQNSNPINQNISNLPIINFNINNQFNIINSIQDLPNQTFNSINNGSNYIPLFINNSNIINTEMKGKKGWICHFCNNFNYENRTKCNRCKSNKSPKINKSKKCNNNNKNLNININIDNNNSNENKKNNLTSSVILNNDKKSQKYFSERIGDWICFYCKNLNFAFRKVCNRCQIPKETSESLLQQFNNINIFPSKI